MSSKTLWKGIVLLLFAVSLTLSGCANKAPTSEEEITTLETTAPETMTTAPGKTSTGEVEEIVPVPQTTLTLRDSLSIVNPATIDKLFTISHQGGEPLPARDVKINIYYQSGEQVDSLTFNSNTDSFEGSVMKSSAFFDETLDPGDVIAITELPGFNLESHTILKVKVIDINSNQPILDEELEVM
jgi:hypothetical protein